MTLTMQPTGSPRRGRELLAWSVVVWALAWAGLALAWTLGYVPA